MLNVGVQGVNVWKAKVAKLGVTRIAIYLTMQCYNVQFQGLGIMKSLMAKVTLKGFLEGGKLMCFLKVVLQTNSALETGSLANLTGNGIPVFPMGLCFRYFFRSFLEIGTTTTHSCSKFGFNAFLKGCWMLGLPMVGKINGVTGFVITRFTEISTTTLPICVNSEMHFVVLVVYKLPGTFVAKVRALEQFEMNCAVVAYQLFLKKSNDSAVRMGTAVALVCFKGHVYQGVKGKPTFLKKSPVAGAALVNFC